MTKILKLQKVEGTEKPEAGATDMSTLSVMQCQNG